MDDSYGRARELKCSNCEKVTESHLLFYGAAPLWWCSPTCEQAWYTHVAPVELRRLLGDVDEEEDE